MITPFQEAWLAYFLLAQTWPQYYNTETLASEIHEHCVTAALLLTENLLPSPRAAFHQLYVPI